MAENNSNIVDLVELQLIENALKARSSEMEKLKDHPELRGIMKKQEESKASLKEAEGSFHELDLKRKKLEDTVGINEEKIKSNEKKLFSGSITDSKELSGYQNEIESLKKSNARMEDEILVIMEEQEEKEPNLEILNKEIIELDNQVKRIEAEINEKREVLKHNIEGLNNRKKDVVSRMSQDVLKRYNEMKARKNGIAVSIIKDNFCGICNMEIPSIDTEKFIDSDMIYNCPVCGRLSVLYRTEFDDIKKELELD